MVEDAVEPKSYEAGTHKGVRTNNVVALVRDAAARTLYSAATALTPVVILEDRAAGDPLPTEAGVYLFKDPNCLGRCAKVRGRSYRLRTYFTWTPQSAYSVGAGALWRDELSTSKAAPAPDEEFPPNQRTRLNTLDFIPKAAEKR